VVQHHLDDDPNPTLMSRVQDPAEIVQRSVAGMDRIVVRDVVAIIAKGRREKWHQPYRADPQFLKVIKLLFKPEEIANSIAIAVVECADMNLIDDRVLV